LNVPEDQAAARLYEKPGFWSDTLEIFLLKRLFFGRRWKPCRHHRRNGGCSACDLGWCGLFSGLFNCASL